MLRAEQLATLDRLLDRLTALPPEQRAAWIDALEGDEAALAPTLRKLLAQPGGLEGGDDDATWAPPLRQALAGALGATAGGFEAGSTVGPYRLLRPLGEGGMGMVWLAERIDGTLRRQVALKLPRPGLQRWRLDERFARERDILGSLEHPNIARLYEAGLAADGQPFLAMEYVAGRSITEHVKANATDVRHILQLFLQVLAAVQHAHQRLVVHRDLKPSNILVDDEGRVRLLDFGIALLQDESRPQAALTEVGQALLTPQYASPEQVARAPVSTASDLYSLGVVLCELLAGRGPHAPTRETRAALEEAILQGEPQRPSRIAPPERRAALRGDLDNIVLKALKRNPVERYASADAFAQDLQHHLDGAPVGAHPDGAAYRLRKFAARNRLAVAAGAGIAFALLAGIGVALWQAGLAREQASAARREAQRAQAVQGFLVGLFNEADPARAQGRELTARDLMARAERELQSQLMAEPDSAAAVRGAMVDIYLKLGDEARALPLAQAQVEQARQRHGARSLEAAQALTVLGQTLSRHARSDEALRVLDEAQGLLAPLQATQRQGWLDLQRERAQTLLEMRRLPDAEQLMQQILPAMVEQYGAAGWEVIQMRASLALAFALDGRVTDAEPIFVDLERHLADVGPERATQAATLRSEMGYGWTVLGRWSDARRLLEQSRTDFDRFEGPRNSDSIRAQRTLLTLLIDSGDYPAAAAVARDNMRRSREFYGAADAEYGLDLSFAVIALVMTGQGAEAEAVARESVRIGTASASLTEGERNGLRRRLALALLFNGHAAEAQPMLQALAEADPNVVVTRMYLSGALRLQGQPEAAAGHAAEAAASLRRRATMASQLMAGHALLTETLAWAAAGRTETAQARLDDAMALLKPRLQPGHVLLTAAELMHAAVLRSAGQTAAAAALERSTRATLQRQGVVLPTPVPLLP